VADAVADYGAGTPRVPDPFMQRFTFKLESVRALREQVEKQAQEALAHELAADAARRAELERAGARLDEATRAGTPETVSGPDLAARQAFVERLERERLDAHASVARQEREVALRRLGLERAAREREALERLKRRRLAAHRLVSARAEEATLSEIGLQRHVRNAWDDAA